MVNYPEEYERLLRQGAQVLEELLHLYLPDKQAENDWADVSAADTRNKRNSLLERLAGPPQLSAAEASTLVVSLGHYLDSHWADYQADFPVANAAKRSRLEALHAELTAVVKGFGQLYNALRTA